MASSLTSQAHQATEVRSAEAPDLDRRTDAGRPVCDRGRVAAHRRRAVRPRRRDHFDLRRRPRRPLPAGLAAAAPGRGPRDPRRCRAGRASRRPEGGGLMRKPSVSGRGWAYIGAALGGTVSIAANVAHSYVPPTVAPADWTPQTGA